MRKDIINNCEPLWSVDGDGDDCIFVKPCPCCEATTLTIHVDSATVGYRLDDIAALEGLRDCLDAAIEHHKTRSSPLEPEVAGSPRPAAQHGDHQRSPAGRSAARRSKERKTRRNQRGK